MRSSEASSHEALSCASIDNGGRSVNAFDSDLGMRLSALVFKFNVGSHGVDHGCERFLVGRLHTNHSHTVASDSVVEVAGIEACKAIFDFSVEHVENASQLLSGTCQALVDVGTRVATHEFANLDSEILEVGRSSLWLIVEPYRGNHTTCASDSDHAVVFAVEVEQIVAHEHVGLDVGGTGEAGFFVNGSESFERTALDVGVGERCQCDSQAQAVVSTEGGVGCKHPVVDDAGLDRVGEEVVIRRRELFSHHVHVALEHYPLSVFKTWCGWTEHSHITYFINLALKIVFLCKTNQPFTNFVEIARRTRHFCDRVENLPNASGF